MSIWDNFIHGKTHWNLLPLIFSISAHELHPKNIVAKQRMRAPFFILYFTPKFWAIISGKKEKIKQKRKPTTHCIRWQKSSTLQHMSYLLSYNEVFEYKFHFYVHCRKTQKHKSVFFSFCFLFLNSRIVLLRMSLWIAAGSL